jgi:TPR repeat protein
MNDAVPLARTNPFPGLRPFREDEEHLFFGRESQVDAMVDKLADTHFLAVVGTSGSGKSSLVNCGLRPALRQGLMARAGVAWRMAQSRPGNDPIGAMARALGKGGVLFREDAEEGLPLAEIVETSLRMSKLGLIDVFEQARLQEGVNLLVVVDQFEELFRYRQLETALGDQRINEDAAAFVNLLLEVKQQKTYPIFVVLTMRSDFLGDCTQFLGLAEAINAGQYLVPRLTRDERRAAIEGPVRVGGAEIAPVLLTRLVNDVGDNPDQLSILQHALNRTWARWREDGGGGPLDLRHYEAIGTMASALDQHAEQSYAELGGPRRQQICELLFKALTDKATDPRGVRRPTKLGDLCALTDSTEAEVIEVIDVFRAPSRSFLMPPAADALQARTVIDISHESLMRVWRRLNSWADEEAQSAQTYRSLAEAAALHADGRVSLWRDPELQSALNWRDNNRPNESWGSRYHPGFASAMDFLAQSREAREAERTERQQQRQRELDAAKEKAEAQVEYARRMRLRAVLCGALAGLALICLAVASFAYLSAVSERKEAETQRKAAEEHKTAALQQKAEAEHAKAVAEQQKAVAEEERAKAVQIDRLEQGFLEASLDGGAPRSGDARPLAETDLGKIADLARNGSDTFAEMMGAIFERGITVSRNLDRAIPWYSIAADHERVVAMRKLGEIYELGDTTNGLARDLPEAQQWYEKASDRGDSEAMRRLGAIYQNGAEPVKALQQYDKAADHDNAVAWCDLGLLIEKRQVTQEDIAQELKKARQWTETRTPVDMRNCGLLYENGQGVQRDLGKAFGWYDMAAGGGDIVAMRSLGNFYSYGQAVPRDYRKARFWYEKAAAAGDTIGLRSLGFLYESTLGGFQNYSKARELLQEAANAGDTIAARGLGFLYQNGQGGPQDYVKALEWFEKSAEAGDIFAMRSLGFLYQNGQGGPQDYAKAREWFEKAAAAGDVLAMRSLGVLHENSLGGPQDPAQAREWYERAARLGNALAMCDLGLVLLRGVDGTKDGAKAREWSNKSASVFKQNCGVQYQGSKDYAKAREWFENAAQAGDTSAMRSLGSLYENGESGLQDFVKARQWFENAAQAGDTSAMRSLGSLYENSESGLQDFAKARQWYETAAAAGDVRAMRSLGLLYENGQVGPPDFTKAREWYEKAASQGHDALAMCNVAFMFEQGLGAPKDPAKAQEWLDRGGASARQTCGDSYGNKSDRALFARDFTLALAAAEGAQALEPDKLWIELNHAHALMFLDRTEEARALYLSHRDEPTQGGGNPSWRQAIAADFAKFRATGLVNPLMDEIGAVMSHKTH